MTFLKINQLNINCVELNKTAPETIVMIHGMLTNMSVFYLKIAPKLSEKYHVVLYDMRGHGLSEIASSGYDLQSMSKDLWELLDVLGLEKVHLVGYSYGGLIALNTAICHPEKTDKIAIIDSPNPTGELPQSQEQYNPEFFEQYMRKYSLSTQLIPSSRHMEKLHKLYRHLFEKTSILNDLSQNKGFFAQIAQACLQNETLLLYAEGSDCHEAGKFLHEHINKSRLLFGEGDHNIPVQNPAWITEKLCDFFTSGEDKIL
jgi:pimeloyl-ACP methyl ester carboxylesterase